MKIPSETRKNQEVATFKEIKSKNFLELKKAPTGQKSYFPER